MAGMIVNGVQAGKKIRNGKFDLGDVWNYRSDILNDSDSIRQVQFSPERNTDFKFLLVYNPDSLNENKLLFEMARFNFTNFLVRNFEIEIEDIEGMHQMQLSGFRSYDEAYQYARQLFSSDNVVAQMNKETKGIIISEQNLKLIGTAFSYKDYEDFYAKHFVPLKVTKRYLLSEPAEIASPREKERDLQEEVESRNPTERDLNIQEQMNVPANNGMTIPIEEEPVGTGNSGGVIIPDTKPVGNVPTPPAQSSTDSIPSSKNPIPSSTEVVVPVDEPAAPSVTEIIIPVDETPASAPKTKPVSPETPVERKPETPVAAATAPSVPTSPKPRPQQAQPATAQPTTPSKPATQTSATPVPTIDNNTMEIPMDNAPATPVGTFEIPMETEPQTPVGTFEIPMESPKPAAPKAGNGTPKAKPATNAPTATAPSAKPGAAQKTTPAQQKPAQQPKKQTAEGPVIYFEDAPKAGNNNQKKQTTPVLDYDFDDEYYDLDGF